MSSTFYQKLLIFLIILLVIQVVAMIGAWGAPYLVAIQQIASEVDPKSPTFTLIQEQVSKMGAAAVALLMFTSIATTLGIADVWEKISKSK